MSAGKRTPLSIEMKLEVLEALKTKSKIDVSREFGIGYSTVKKIKQNEVEILKKVSTSSNLLRIRNRQSPNGEVGDALITWFRQMKSQNIPVNGPIMLDKAKELAMSLGFEDFKPSHGWLERLKARHNIRFLKPSTKRYASGNIEPGDWIKNFLPMMLEGYNPNDIFNADESALFYKAAPSILTGIHVQNGVIPKDRLTVLFLCNATGTEKKAYVIGKVSSPPCFDKEGTPLPYYSSTDALMTEWIWRDILQKLDQSLGTRKIVLFVDNDACHKIKMELKNIKIALVPTSSSLTQPLDQGIIRMVKIHYRALLLKKLISVLNNGILASDFAKTIDLLQALRILETAWFSVSPAMIVGCFQKAGFCPDDVYCVDELPDSSNEESELMELLQEEFETFVECDKDVDCFETSVDSKVSTVEKETTAGDECDEVVEDTGAPTVSRVSHEEALNALSVIRKYLDENFTEYNAYYEVEEMIRLNAYANSSAESEIDSFSFNC